MTVTSHCKCRWRLPCPFLVRSSSRRQVRRQRASGPEADKDAIETTPTSVTHLLLVPMWTIPLFGLMVNGGLKINEDVTWLCVREKRGCENSCEFCEDDQHLTDQQTTSLANRKEKKRIVFPVDLIPSQAWRWAQGCKICRMNYLRLARGKHVT